MMGKILSIPLADAASALEFGRRLAAANRRSVGGRRVACGRQRPTSCDGTTATRVTELTTDTYKCPGPYCPHCHPAGAGTLPPGGRVISGTLPFRPFAGWRRNHRHAPPPPPVRIKPADVKVPTDRGYRGEKNEFFMIKL
jgi:hypothetical protein